MVSRIIEKLASYLVGPESGEDSVGHMLDEDVDGGVAALVSGETSQRRCTPL